MRTIRTVFGGNLAQSSEQLDNTGHPDIGDHNRVGSFFLDRSQSRLATQSSIDFELPMQHSLIGLQDRNLIVYKQIVFTQIGAPNERLIR